MKEEQIIFRMMDDAGKYGLVFEVASNFVRYMRGGNSVGEAAWAALYDWDV